MMKSMMKQDLLIEDVELSLADFEKNFGIQWEQAELSQIKNIQELCELASDKITKNQDDLCTTQMAFYQFRSALQQSAIPINKLSPKTNLKEIFPLWGRKSKLKRVGKIMGYPLQASNYNQKINNINLFLMVLSISLLFVDWRYSIIGFGLLFIFHTISQFFLFSFTTVRQMLENSAARSYFEIRKNKNTFNKKELQKCMLKWFSLELQTPIENLKTLDFK